MAPDGLVASPDVDSFILGGLGECERLGRGAGQRHGWSCVDVEPDDEMATQRGSLKRLTCL